MRNRLGIWLTGFAILEAFLIVQDVYKNLIVNFNWCSSVLDEVCISKNVFQIFFYSLVLFFVIFSTVEGVVWVIKKSRENNAFGIKEYDSTPYTSSIAVINKSYPVIENCAVELIRANVLNNKGCQTIFDERMNIEKIPRLFIWDNELTNKDLSKNSFGKTNIALTTKDEKIIFLTEKGIDYFPIYPDRKNGSSAKKAKYQIEVKVSGKVNSDGTDKVIEKNTFWEIGYRYKGDHYNSQNIWIKKIDKLEETNDFRLGKPIPKSSKFNLVIEKEKKS